MEKLFFVRPGANLSNVKLTSKGANEIMVIDGRKCEVFGNAKWTAIRPLPEPKTAKTARKSSK